METAWTPLERAPESIARGREVWLKREDLHELGSFKWGGALPVGTAFGDGGASVVVTASTGNHGAATAWAAARVGVEAVVYAPSGTSEVKLERMRSLGASIRLVGADLDVAKDAAREFAASAGVPFFEDGAELAQFDGYRAIGRELVEQVGGEVGAVVLPVGNGALLAG